MLILNAVEFLNEHILRLVPFIEIQHLPIPWECLVASLEVCFIALNLRVDIDGAGNLKLNIEHLPGVSESPDLKDAWLEGLSNLYHMPVGFQHNLVHVSDEGGYSLILGSVPTETTLGYN
jgi:hypothetical protein